MQRTTTILACLFFSFNCLSQSKISGGQYPFVHYTPKDGLVNSRVKKAYQDSKGRMYFLTYGGLSVFDGARFRNYTKKSGLVTDVLNDILEVGDDSFLVATNSEHNLNVLDKGKIGILKMAGARCGIVNQFYRHEDGKLYLSSDDGLFTLKKDKVRELDVSYLSKTSRELPYLGNISGVGNWLVFSTHELRDHRGLYLYDIKNNRVCDALPEPQVYLLGKDKTNHIWIGMSGKLYVLDPDALSKGKLFLVPPMSGYAQSKHYSTVNIAFSESSIWFLFRNKDYGNIEIHHIEETGALSRIPLPKQATTSEINYVIVDKENTIWLCNDGDGIFKIVKTPMQIFENPFGELAQNRSNNAFYSNNITWHTTRTNKLFRKSEKGLEEFRCNLGQSPYLFYARGNKLLARDTRNIYEAICDDQKKFIRFNKLISLPDSDFFANKAILDCYGTIIAVQRNGLGVWKNKKMIDHKSINRVDVIEELAFDKNNLLWVVRRYTGIDVFKLQPGDPMNYLQSIYHFGKEKLIGSPRCCVVDKNGLIWIGTRENGIIGYKLESGHLNKLFQFDAGSGLTDNFATTLACDSSNNIIVGTQTGLDRIVFNSNSYRVENLGKSSNIFAFISQAWADAKQAYAFTSTGTLLQLSAAQKANRNNIPQLLLEEMKVNAQTVSTEKQKFRYKENNISFFMAAPSFIDEKEVAFSYLLQGSRNKQWSDTTATNSVINLTNLSAGEYILKVKAFFPSTTYSPSEFSYAFEVTPPWWQTWWFISSVVILLADFLFFLYGYRVRQALKLERLRQKISTDLHDDIGSTLSSISILSDLASKEKDQNQTGTMMQEIKYNSVSLMEKMDDIVWSINPQNDSIENLMIRIKRFASKLLEAKEIDYTIDIDSSINKVKLNMEARQHIYLIMKEAINNQVKYSNCSSSYIGVNYEHNLLKIEISDNGKGFNQNNFRPGNGIISMKKRAEAVGGEIKIMTEPGQGTKILLQTKIK